MNELKLRVGFVTDTGRVRERNEDALSLYLPYAGEERIGPLDGLFVVADGMGGHDAGDQASRFVADAVAQALTRGATAPGRDEGAPTGDVIADWLRRALVRIDRELRQQVRDIGLPKQAGSTATVAALMGNTLHLAHVGDSRAYRMRDGALQQLTRDHSWVAEQVRAGRMSEAVAATHEKRHMLTHCLGIGQPPTVDISVHAVEPGDRFMLSSDGLHGVVPDPVIVRALAEEPEPQSAAHRLARLANEAGGPDNITVIVIDASRDPVLAASDVARGPAVTVPTGQASSTGETSWSPAETNPGEVKDDSATDTELAAPTIVAAPFVEHSGAGSSLMARVVMVAGVILTIGAAAYGAWRYLDTRDAGAQQVTPDTASAPAAVDPVPSGGAPAAADSTGTVTTGSRMPTPDPGVPTADSRVPTTEPDTLDPGARS